MTSFAYKRYKTPIADIFEEEKQLELQLLVERKLAEANAVYGKIPQEAAEEIEKYVKLENISLKRVKEIEKETRHDLFSVIMAATEVCPNYGQFIHLGATSSDIQDTVTALQLKEAKNLLLEHIDDLLYTLIQLAKKYRNLVCIGRTHGKHAIPTTYGFKFANFLNELYITRENLLETVIYGKLSGAVGTYAAYGTSEIEKDVMRKLGLESSMISTQVVPRVIYFHFVSSLIAVSAVLDKLARELRNLQRTEIGEVSETSTQKQVGSSTMPQKQNPWRLERICGIARYLRSIIPSVIENVSLEHERDMSNSSNERIILPQLIILIDFSLLEMKELLNELIINEENVERNLYLLKGRQCSENLLVKLTSSIGRQKAHEILRDLTKEDDFVNAVKNHPQIKTIFLEKEIDDILDPKKYIGLAPEIVDRVVENIERNMKKR
ncbi:MAG: adenylosuccinate lyase [Candidatus Heimdallarchaeota archaeon]|nr:MAG: adenylosuccinate lyase [Candidatus Heimdallarchaeota archaeon]